VSFLYNKYAMLHKHTKMSLNEYRATAFSNFRLVVSAFDNISVQVAANRIHLVKMLLVASAMGVRRNFFRGGQSRNFASAYTFGLLTMQRIWTYTKRFTLSTPQRKCLKL